MMKLKAIDLEYHAWILGAVWTAAILASLGWNLYQLQKSILEQAYTSATISYDKDLLYRRWVANQGGVYVAVSKMTPPNPYLTVPDRDLEISPGRSLTLVNPAYMTRQVNELTLEMHHFQGHITSLKPIRPENRPDPWEAQSLKSFEQGAREARAIASIGGEEYFRFMKPFVTEKSCLKCHAAQGYREGDIRGGISVSIPMSPLRTIEHSRRGQLILAHGFLWLIGLVGIGAGTARLKEQTRQRERLEEELLALSMTDPLTGLCNRRGFQRFAEQQLNLADRTGRGLILFFADLDGMKGINDKLGHEEGDRALIDTAAVLKRGFRSSDVVARMGGDEFVVLAIEPDILAPEDIVGRLHDEIDRHNRQCDRKYALSLSLGYASYDPAHPVSLVELMTRADNAMYARKRERP